MSSRWLIAMVVSMCVLGATARSAQTTIGALKARARAECCPCTTTLSGCCECDKESAELTGRRHISDPKPVSRIKPGHMTYVAPSMKYPPAIVYPVGPVDPLKEVQAQVLLPDDVATDVDNKDERKFNEISVMRNGKLVTEDHEVDRNNQDQSAGIVVTKTRDANGARPKGVAFGRDASGNVDTWAHTVGINKNPGCNHCKKCPCFGAEHCGCPGPNDESVGYTPISQEAPVACNGNGCH